MQKAQRSLEGAFEKVKAENRAYFEPLNNFEVAVDNKLKKSCDFSNPFYESVDLDEAAVSAIVKDHMQKQGYKETLAAMASDQTGIPADSIKTQVDLFEQLEDISKQLDEHKTEAALRWSKDHKFEISKESNLLFLLHQINMREMLAKAVDI